MLATIVRNFVVSPDGEGEAMPRGAAGIVHAPNDFKLNFQRRSE
jgi:hypothetical protein